jgi:hypothetical protein
MASQADISSSIDTGARIMQAGREAKRERITKQKLETHKVVLRKPRLQRRGG